MNTYRGLYSHGEPGERVTCWCGTALRDENASLTLDRRMGLHGLRCHPRDQPRHPA